MLETIGYTYEKSAKAAIVGRLSQGGLVSLLQSKGLRWQKGFHKLGSGFSALSGTIHAARVHQKLQKRTETLLKDGMAEEDVAKDPKVEKQARKLAEGMHEVL